MLISEFFVMLTLHFCCVADFIFAIEVMHTYNPSLN